MGWTDEHLHQFTIRGRRYHEAHEGVLQFSTVANELALTAFGLREHEGFIYVYDFNACGAGGAVRMTSQSANEVADCALATLRAPRPPRRARKFWQFRRS